MDVEAFFRPWETDIESFDDINEKLTDLFEDWIALGRVFAWRGVVDARWPLHSSLYRRLMWSSTTAKAPDEPRLFALESQVLTSVHRWGLHNGERGRLSVLAQLATLQHFGAPTRLIDVTLNAYIGLWFAVQQPILPDGLPTKAEIDGRLFAIDITNRLINEQDEDRDWEDQLDRPWKRVEADGSENVAWRNQWCGQAWAWRPPAFERRIAAQNGAFLFVGVPRTGVGIAWPTRGESGKANWGLDEVRRCVSVPLRFHVAAPLAGGVPKEKGQPAYTFRIKAGAKPEIRERLRTLFGFQHATIYPDFPGFAAYAEPFLRNQPPSA
jgi:hypothetical protein